MEQTEKKVDRRFKKEPKKRITFSIKPSVYEQAINIAYEKGMSLSQYVEDALQKFVDENEKKG